MAHSTAERKFILVFRLLMAWTFLYAASHQVFNPKFSAAGFLRQTKTFHDVYAVLATQAMDPILTFLVSYGHLLIGLSLLLGLMVRVSGAFGCTADDVLDRPHGLAIYREHKQLHYRLPHRLRDSVRLSDHKSRGARLGPRRLGRKAPLLSATPIAAATGGMITVPQMRVP